VSTYNDTYTIETLRQMNYAPGIENLHAMINTKPMPYHCTYAHILLLIPHYRPNGQWHNCNSHTSS